MKLLVTVLILLGIAAALPVLVPVLSLGLALAVAFGGFLVWVLPILIIACSERTGGAEKLAWILAIVFLSWFAWIFYFLLAPIKDGPDRLEYRHRYRRRHQVY